MNSPHHLARVLLSFFGFAVFLMLALGSRDSHDSYSSSYSPSPEVVGQENAMTWAKTNSTDLAKKIHQVELRRENAQSEVYRLETLKDQFPAHANEITDKINEWEQVVIELDLALTAVRQYVSAAYVANQGQGKDRSAVLREVYSQWSFKADQAIALAKKQRAKSGG